MVSSGALNVIKAICKLDYPGFSLDLSLSLPSEGITALFGHSGSGKTSFLRFLSGLEKSQTGFLSLNDQIWQDSKTFVPTYRRDLGYVFQEAYLFPHLSVQQNLEYGFRRISAATRKVQLEQVICLLGLNKCLERNNPRSLSGGEKQRVAIGRALLTSPQLLLMDEPLSALDHQSKQEIMAYLKQIYRELAIPVIYVSHLLSEVLHLADYLVVFEQGKNVGEGPLQTVLTDLKAPLAQLENAASVLLAQVRAHDATYHLSQLGLAGSTLWVSLIDSPPGTQIRLSVQAQDVNITVSEPHNTSISNILHATIQEICPLGNALLNLVLALVDGQLLLARITRYSCQQLGLQVGLPVFAQIKSMRAVV